MIVQGGPALSKKDASAIVPAVSRSITLKPGEASTQPMTIQMPTQTGDYTLVAEYGAGPDRVQCVRDFVVGKQPHWAQTRAARTP
jgi:hypothetical protein